MRNRNRKAHLHDMLLVTIIIQYCHDTTLSGTVKCKCMNKRCVYQFKLQASKVSFMSA